MNLKLLCKINRLEKEVEELKKELEELKKQNGDKNIECDSYGN